jgi:hypothetical protein
MVYYVSGLYQASLGSSFFHSPYHAAPGLRRIELFRDSESGARPPIRCGVFVMPEKASVRATLTPGGVPIEDLVAPTLVFLPRQAPDC